MLTRRRVLAVLAILLVAIGATFGGAALGETLGLRGGGGEGDTGLLTSDPAESSDPRAVAPKGSLSIADAQGFQGFPLFWPGSEYAGLPLTATIRADYVSYERSGIQVRDDSVTFLYGSCIPPAGEGGCAAPFQVIVQSACQSPPGLAPDFITKGQPFALRGALAQEYADGHIQLWTQGVSVTIFGPDAESMRALAEALRPLNSLASTEPDGQLKPPAPLETLDCPPLSPGTLPDNPTGMVP